MNFVEPGMGSHWPVNIHHLLGRVAAGGDFSYGGPSMGGGAQKHKQVESWDQGPAPESAFLGPQLWDRKICMKMNEIGWSVGHGGYPQYADSNTPSPPQFQQVGDIDCHTVTQEKFSRIFFCSRTTRRMVSFRSLTPPSLGTKRTRKLQGPP